MSHIEEFGVVEGQKVQLAIIKNGAFVAAISTLGAAIVWYGSKDRNYVLYHKSAEGYLNDSSYMGKIVGPYANRIENAEFFLDGRKYTLDKNDGENNLHSGSASFANKLWSISGISDSSVTLSLKTPEEGGFPGEHETEVTYLLSSEGILTLDYKATSSKKCPVGLTNHAYFFLDSRGSRDVELEIKAEKFVAVDSHLIPLLDNPQNVEGTDFDFRVKTRIGDRREGKYDNTWVLEKNSVIKAEGNLASLFIRTTEPGIQVYTGEFLKGEDTEPFFGLALETGRFPNTPVRLDFPSAFTDKGVVFESTTSFLLVPKE